MEFLSRSSPAFIEMAAMRPNSARLNDPTTELEKGNQVKIDINSSDRKDFRSLLSGFMLTLAAFSLTNALVDTHKQKQRAVKNFYGKQNEQIKSMLLSVDQHRSSADDEANAKGLRNKIAIYGSLIGNLLLAGLQLYGAVSSGSLSLFATMVDSIFDPVSNIIMLYCHRSARHADETKWPSGKARMTTVGNICFCFIMACASAILIVESIREIVSHLSDPNAAPKEIFHLSSVLAVTGAFTTKVCLMLYCWPLKSANSQIQILWEDHRNDLFINGLGIITSVLGSKVVWWLDPGGAMLLSILIIASWGNTALGEFKLLIGISAKPEFLQLVTYTCVTHHKRVLQLDTCRAYHSGEGIIIEVDVVMAKELTLGETHDVAEDLQNKLERLPGVERCYVHCDFETTHKPEHRKNV